MRFVVPSSQLSRLQIVSLILAAIYLPFTFIFFTDAVRGNVQSVLMLWPIFPGLALAALGHLRDLGAALFFTVLLPAASIYLALRFRKLFWPLLAGLLLASFGLAYIVLLILRA